MIIGTESTGGEAAVGAEIDLIGTVGETETTTVEAGAIAEALTTAKMMVKEGMMMRGGAKAEAVAEAAAAAAADHVEVLHLVDAVPVPREARHQEQVLGVKVPVDVFVRTDLQLQGVHHHA